MATCLLTLGLLPAQAQAKVQRVALPKANFSLKAGNSKRVTAFCIDERRKPPTSKTTLRPLTQDIKVKSGSQSFTLEEAMAQGLIEVAGADPESGIGAVFRNSSGKDIDVIISQGAQLGEPGEKARAIDKSLKKLLTDDPNKIVVNNRLIHASQDGKALKELNSRAPKSKTYRVDRIHGQKLEFLVSDGSSSPQRLDTQTAVAKWIKDRHTAGTDVYLETAGFGPLQHEFLKFEVEDAVKVDAFGYDRHDADFQRVRKLLHGDAPKVKKEKTLARDVFTGDFLAEVELRGADGTRGKLKIWARSKEMLRKFVEMLRQALTGKRSLHEAIRETREALGYDRADITIELLGENWNWEIGQRSAPVHPQLG